MDTALDLIQVIVGIATVVGLFFAAWQVLHLTRESRDRDRCEIDGVSVTWETLESPATSDRGGRARWRYEFTITNPGRMPIDNVQCTVAFPVAVQRIRYNGDAEPPSRSITLYQPVIVGGGQRTWTRTLELDFDERSTLADVSATVSFRDITLNARTNDWPRKIR